MIKDKNMQVHKSEQATFTEWWLLQTWAADWVGTFQGNSGTVSSSLHCIYIKKSQSQHETVFYVSTQKALWNLLFVLQCSFSFCYNHRDTPLDLIHPKPHGSSIFLTMLIDILMGPPLINTWIKTNYLLPHMTNAQKSALTSHSRSISTFCMTACVLVIYWE